MPRDLKYQERDPNKGRALLLKAKTQLRSIRSLECGFSREEIFESINKVLETDDFSHIDGKPLVPEIACRTLDCAVDCAVSNFFYIIPSIRPSCIHEREEDPLVLSSLYKSISNCQRDIDLTGKAAETSYERAVLSLGNNALAWMMPGIICKQIGKQHQTNYYYKDKAYMKMFSRAMRNQKLTKCFLDNFPISYGLGKSILVRLANKEYPTQHDRAFVLAAKTLLNLGYFHNEVTKMLWTEHNKDGEDSTTLHVGEHDLQLGDEGYIEAYVEQMVDLSLFADTPFPLLSIGDAKDYLVTQVLALQEEGEAQNNNNNVEEGDNNPLFSDAEIKFFIVKSILTRIKKHAGVMSGRIMGMNDANAIKKSFMDEAGQNDALSTWLVNKMFSLSEDNLRDEQPALPIKLTMFEAARAHEVVISTVDE